MEMENFEKDAILKLVNSNSRKGVSKDQIIEYLDYLLKIRYSDEEISEMLKELKKQQKIKSVRELWYPY